MEHGNYPLQAALYLVALQRMPIGIALLIVTAYLLGSISTAIVVCRAIGAADPRVTDGRVAGW